LSFNAVNIEGTACSDLHTTFMSYEPRKPGSVDHGTADLPARMFGE
jgi:hypothetical protein